MECLRVLSTSGTRFRQGTTIPTEFGNLKDLTSLLLAFSGVEGTLPSELGRLAGNFTIFDASSRADDEAKIAGTIPSEIGLLSNLRTFTCGNCRLEGTLPAQLGQMRKLELLSLGPSDALTGTIPPSVGGLANLKYARIAHSKLSGSIPSELGLATGLVRMYLMKNQLSGNLPSELGRMTQLESAYLNGNKNIKGSFPPEVTTGWATSLVSLNISQTEITGDMPDSFCNMPGYFEFDCSWTTCGCNCICVIFP